MDKLFQIKIKTKNDWHYFHVIRVHTIEGIMDALNEYNARHGLGGYISSKRSWSYTTNNSHTHRFENGVIRIAPLKIEDF